MKDQASTTRRVHLERMVPAEAAIYNAALEVEKLGCDLRLTDAVVLLAEARMKVGDFVDNIPHKENVRRDNPKGGPPYRRSSRAFRELERWAKYQAELCEHSEIWSDERIEHLLSGIMGFDGTTSPSWRQYIKEVLLPLYIHEGPPNDENGQNAAEEQLSTKEQS